MSFTAILGHLCGGREHKQVDLASLIAPSGSKNTRVSCCCRKLSGSKAKKRGSSRDLHMISRNILGTDFTRAIDYTRAYLSVCTSDSFGFCDTPRVLHSVLDCDDDDNRTGYFTPLAHAH